MRKKKFLIFNIPNWSLDVKFLLYTYFTKEKTYMHYPTFCWCCSPINTWHINYFVHISCQEINTSNVPLLFLSLSSSITIGFSLSLGAPRPTYIHQITMEDSISAYPFIWSFLIDCFFPNVSSPFQIVES